MSRACDCGDRLLLASRAPSEGKEALISPSDQRPDQRSRSGIPHLYSHLAVGSAHRGGAHHEPVPTTSVRKGHIMASHQNRNRHERRREMQIVLDWLDLNGRGIDKLYDHLIAGPGGKRQFRAHYRVEPFLDEPDVFAFQIATVRKLRTDPDFQRCAEEHFLLQYDRDEAAAAQAGFNDVAALRRQHWGDDPNIVEAGRRLLSLLRAGVATSEQYRAAEDQWGSTWKDLATFDAHATAAA